ncbi:MAG: ATP-binding cassette domain-containing protein [Bifidobacteriaceae bacterium]|jgi:ABC-2 type transport system ATP-binding protein|nr:ATP-binding cassette domain-containing protein [Bifidobacteriaceae bacterium]
MIQIEGLTKRFGRKLAVDHLTFTVEAGHVTGFLGPNGSGKSTTMRMIVGLTRPTAGAARVDGQPFARSASPLTEVGALLDAKAAAPGRSGLAHLRALAATHRIPRRRVDEVIGMTGLESVIAKRVKTYSLGMGQRLGIAAALLGDPSTVILDEPVNGLDPEGVKWVRQLAKGLAAEGRTVFISSHLMAEMALTADRLIIIGRGRLIADSTVDAVVAASSEVATRVRSPQAAQIAVALASPQVTVTTEGPDTLLVTGLGVEEVGQAAARNGWVVYELSAVTASLEEAYMKLTDTLVEYRSSAQPAATTEGAGK